MSVRELIVIGGGPAGLSAALFAASEGIDTVLLATEVGGQAGTSSMIENYMGFPVGVSGDELTKNGEIQAYRMGVDVREGCRVFAIEETTSGNHVVMTNLDTFIARAVIIATGITYREIKALPKSGRVHYGVGTKSFDVERGADYLVYGGANSAAQAAVDLAERGGNVAIVSRSPLSKAVSLYMIDKLKAVNVAIVEGIEVEESTEFQVEVLVKFTDGHSELHGGDQQFFDHVFVFVGGVPNVTDDFGVFLDEKGRVLTGLDVQLSIRGPFETSTPGVYAIGDVRHGSLPRIAAAVGEGAAVVPIVWRHING